MSSSCSSRSSLRCVYESQSRCNAHVLIGRRALVLVLQAFEGAFYREGLKRFGLQDMMAAGLSQAQALVVYVHSAGCNVSDLTGLTGPTCTPPVSSSCRFSSPTSRTTVSPSPPAPRPSNLLLCVNLASDRDLRASSPSRRPVGRPHRSRLAGPFGLRLRLWENHVHCE